jgi:hypothetical protein
MDEELTMRRSFKPGVTLTALCQRHRLDSTHPSVKQRPRLLAVAAATLVVVAASAGVATAAPRRVLLLPFEGPSATEVQSVISSSLASHVVTIPTEQAERAAQLLAARTENTPEAYAALSRRLKTIAVIEGKVVKDDRWRLRLSIRQGGNGTVAGTVSWSGTRFKEMVANVQRGAPYWMQSMLDAADAAPGAGPLDAPAPVARRAAPSRSRALDDEDPPESSRGESRPTTLRSAAAEASAQPMWEVSGGPLVLARTFTYTDNLAGLPGYTLSGAPALALDGSIYPTAGNASSPARNFGFAGHFESSVAVKTVGRNGAASADTSLVSYFIGARYRMPTDNFLFTFGADYGDHRFNIDVQDTAPPNVKYSVLRPSVTARAEAGSNLSLSLTLAYLHVLSVGDLGQNSRFPRDSVVGAEVAAGVGYTVDENFEVKFVADLRHYAHSMHVQAGDPLIVGGALDEHFGAALLVAYHQR